MGAAGARPFCLRKRKIWRWRWTARTACVGADHSRALRSAGEEEKRFRERCLKRKQGTGPQYMSWGAIFKERILRIHVPEFSISCDFLLCFFLGYSVTFLRLAFPQTLALPPPPPMGNTTVKDSLGHVTMRGVHPQLITSASTSSLATHVSREPYRNFSSVLIGGGLCNCSSLRLKLALYSPKLGFRVLLLAS